MDTVWVSAYAVVWVIWFVLFGMQRATLLASRKAGYEWRGGGELLLPKWYPITWIVIVGRWALLGAMAVLWSWKVALALLVVSFILSSILPIPYGMYRPIFQRRVNEVTNYEPDVGFELQRMLDGAPR